MQYNVLTKILRLGYLLQKKKPPHEHRPFNKISSNTLLLFVIFFFLQSCKYLSSLLTRFDKRFWEILFRLVVFFLKGSTSLLKTFNTRLR